MVRASASVWCRLNFCRGALHLDWTTCGPTVQVFLGASGAGVMKGNTTEGPVIVKFWCGLVGEWRQAVEHKPVPLECKDEVELNMECPKKGGLHGHRRCNHRFLDVRMLQYFSPPPTLLGSRGSSARHARCS